MNKKKMICLVVMCLCIGSVMAGVSSSDAASKVELSKKKLVMKAKKTCKLKLKGAKSKKVRWTSSNKRVATVKKGLIRAKKAGKCTIVAKYRGKKYTCNLRVKAEKKAASKKESTKTSTPKESNSDEKVTLKVKSIAQDTKVITYTIANNTGNMESLPVFVTLEMYCENAWKPVARKQSEVMALAMVVKPYETVEKAMDLDEHYENLESGKYRLCLQTSHGMVYAEFTI